LMFFFHSLRCCCLCAVQKKIEELEKSWSEEHRKLEAALNDRQKSEAELNTYKEDMKKQVDYSIPSYMYFLHDAVFHLVLSRLTKSIEYEIERGFCAKLIRQVYKRTLFLLFLND